MFSAAALFLENIFSFAAQELMPW